MKTTDVYITILFYCPYCDADNYLDKIPKTGGIIVCDVCKKESVIDNVDPEFEIGQCSRCGGLLK